MPPTRGLRRVITDENAETTATTRMTRAKAAALETNDSTDAGHGTKRALQTKKAGANRLLSTATTETHATTKRSALLDVSNVSKKDLATVKETVGLKKPLVSSRANLVSKAAQPVGVTKPSRTSSTRSTIANADATKKIKSSEPKRPASGSGVMAAGSKRRVLENKTSNQQIYQDAKSSETTAPKVRQHQAKVEIGDDVATAEYEDCKENENVHADHEKVSSTVEETVPTMTASEIAFVHEVERDDADDPLMVAEYVDDIFDYLNDLQTQTMPNPDYMSQQPNLEWKMRGILVDWLVEVHSKYRLLPETLFLAVNIIDRFLSAKHVPLEKLQLCGITAMFIASKYEEVLAPHISHFRDLADDSITEQEILTAERHMLATLKYDLSYPNPMNFLRRISKADSYDISTRTFGKYLLEMTILDYRFMDCPPSLAAAAAMYLSRLILQKSDWDHVFTYYSGHTEEEIQPVVAKMLRYLASPSVEHDAFFRKYAHKKFGKASLVCRHWAKKAYQSEYPTPEPTSVSQTSTTSTRTLSR